MDIKTYALVWEMFSVYEVDDGQYSQRDLSLIVPSPELIAAIDGIAEKFKAMGTITRVSGENYWPVIHRVQDEHGNSWQFAFPIDLTAAIRRFTAVYPFKLPKINPD